jgi:hypothetical protein
MSLYEVDSLSNVPSLSTTLQKLKHWKKSQLHI